jgi:putative tricarboxylic transport membrane protein
MAVLIGFFAAAEVISMASTMLKNGKKVACEVDKGYFRLRDFKKSHWFLGIKSAFIGTIIGVIPGAGASIASFVSYDAAKRSSKKSEEFGTGCVEGVIAAEAANNATTGGALIPMMTLGIPGDPVTAVLIGAFMIQGLTPGPLLFATEPTVVYSLIAGFLIANIIMFGIGLIGIRFFSRISLVPKQIIAPAIMVICMIGTYSIRSNIFDVGIMVCLGVVGFVMKKHGYPGGPFVIGFILGPLFEKSLRQALTASRGDWSTFLESPICVGFMVVTLLTYVYPMIQKKFKKVKAAEPV